MARFIKGQHPSPKTEFKKGHTVIVSEEERRRRSERMKGHIVTEVTRNKIRETKKKRGIKAPPFPAYVKELNRQRMLGNKIATGIPKSENYKRLASERMKRNNPIFLPTHKHKDTSIELAIEKELKSRNIFYQKQVPLCNSLVDFYIPSLKVVIQCDGCYWHDCPIHFPQKKWKKQERTKRQDQALMLGGFGIYHFWEHEIKESVSGCIDKVLS